MTMPHPDSTPAGYDWYRKLAEMMNKPAISTEEYAKEPLDSWALMIGLKRTKMTQDIMTRHEATTKTAEAVKDVLGQMKR